MARAVADGYLTASGLFSLLKSALFVGFYITVGLGG
jgi:hypothetical protein